MTVTPQREIWISKVSGKPLQQLFAGVQILDDSEQNGYAGSGPKAPIEIEPGPDEPPLQGATAVDPADELDGTDEEEEGVAANLREEDQ